MMFSDKRYASKERNLTYGCVSFCEDHCENKWHLFLGCSKAMGVWITTGLWDSIRSLMINATYFASFFFGI